MFCNQCEQTAKGIGCEKIGVCGKGEDVAVLQDLLSPLRPGNRALATTMSIDLSVKRPLPASPM